MSTRKAGAEETREDLMGKHSKDIRDMPGDGFHVKGPITERILKDPNAARREGGEDDRSSTGGNDRYSRGK